MASFSVVSNIASANAQSNLVITNIGLNRAINRLSSGYRINNAGDDAAGLALANSFRNNVAILNQGIRNANDGLSQLQIKDGALANISQLLDRLATLATQGASAASNVDNGKLNTEFQAVLAEIDREASASSLAGSTTTFSVFVDAGDNGVITGDLQMADTQSLGLSSDYTDPTSYVSIGTTDDAANALDIIAGAVAQIGTAQASIGTLENRLQFAVSLAQSQSVNVSAAESRIRDANVAQESANMTRYNILTQSGIAALSQANQSSSAVLALLR